MAEVVQKYNDTSKDLMYAILKTLNVDAMVIEKYYSTTDDLLEAIRVAIEANAGGGAPTTTFTNQGFTI